VEVVIASGGRRRVYLRISKGKLYLFEERVPLRTHQILRKELSDGRETLYISKHSPQQLRMQFNFDPAMLQTLWLSPRPEDDCIPPMNLEIFEKRVNEFLKEFPHGIVALNGFDVLEMWNGFRPVLEVLKRARSQVNSNGTNFIISVDPKNLNHRSVCELEKLSDIVISSAVET
jgi:hypothetical protein